MNICCVVVTYNRKKLLVECINSLINQTYKLKEIIIIDNNSTDGTKEYLEKSISLNDNKIRYVKLKENIGGAGGFYEGIKYTLNQLYDWVWVMDDDSIPKKDALQELVSSLNILKDESVSFLCSKVIGPENEEMNIPVISKRNYSNGYPIWMKYLNEGIVEVESATFVSVLINFNAIKKVGLPWKQFFIWGDDTEYTLRLSKFYGSGYAVGKSIVVHKRVGAKNLSIIDEDNIDRLNMYKYNYRNKMFLIQYDKFSRKVIVLIKQFLDIIKVLKRSEKFKLKKLSIIVLATINGLFNIKLKKQFKDRMNFN